MKDILAPRLQLEERAEFGKDLVTARAGPGSARRAGLRIQAEVRHRHKMNCHLCKKPLCRARRNSCPDFIKSIIGIYPWRCSHCEKKLYRVRTEQLALVTSICVIALCVPAMGLAWYKGRHAAPLQKAASEEAPKMTVRIPGMDQNPDQIPHQNQAIPQAPSQVSFPDRGQGPVIYMANILHNEDITQMSEAKLTADVIIRLIHNSAHSFRVDPRALIELKKRGTPDEVIREMIDVTASYGPTPRTASAPQAHPASLTTSEVAVEATYFSRRGTPSTRTPLFC